MATAGGKLCGQTDQRLPLGPPAQNDCARCVETDDATNILAEIDAEHGNSHDLSLRLNFRRTHNAGRRGGPSHKIVCAAEQDRPDVATERMRWQEDQNIDETWAKTSMAPAHGRCRRGERLYAKVPHGHWKTTTFVAALRHDGITAPFVLDGPINGKCFLAYVKEVLAPTLPPGDIVLIDNLASHKSPKIRKAIEAEGAELRFLPRYSPDLTAAI